MGRGNVLLLVTGERAAVYFPRSRKSPLVARPRDPGNDVAEEVDALLSALPLKPAKVWVLSSELWTGTIGLAHELVRRVEKRQLPQMIGFEVEPLSGIGAGQARTAVQPLGPAEGQMQFWVTQIETSLVARIADHVAFHGGKLQAILHPAGLPGSLDPAASPAWTRFELWNDVSVLVSGRGRQIEHRFLADGPAVLADADRLAQLRTAAGGGPLSVLVDSAAAATAVEGVGPSLALGSDAELTAFLHAWSQALAGKPTVPSVAPQRPPMSARTRRLVAGGLAAAALLGCAGHYQFSKLRNARLETEMKEEITRLSRPVDAAKAERKKLAETKKTHEETLARQSSLAGAIVRYRDVVGDQRQRIPLLLKSLSRSSDNELLIQNIECDGSELRIVGRCLDPRQAKTLAIALARDLEPTGLIVEPPTTSALNLRADGGPHEFELILHDGKG